MIADDFKEVTEPVKNGTLNWPTEDAKVTFSNKILATKTQGVHIPDVGVFTFDELKGFVKGVKAIKDMLAIQGQPGNWDHSEYMIGLHNGLVLAGIEFGLTTIDDLKHNNPEEPYGH